MDENIIIPEVADIKKKRTKKPLIITLVIIVTLCLALLVAFILTEDIRAYYTAKRLINDGNNADAAVILERLDNYRDSRELLLEVKYEIALDMKNDKDYLAAIEAFEEIKEHENAQKNIEECYYVLGVRAFLDTTQSEADYKQAYEYFLLAGDSEKVTSYKNKSLYNYGHELFMAGDYDRAEEYFGMMDEGVDVGYPHYRDLDAAQELFDECADTLDNWLYLFVGEVPEGFSEDEQNFIFCYLPHRAISWVEYGSDKILSMNLAYYPSRFILNAAKNNDPSSLSEEVKKAYEKAMSVVEEAKNSSNDEFELELWIHDWICDNIVYETPDLENTPYPNDGIGYRQHSCIGGLLDGKANCQGYADTFYLLGTLAGLEVRTIGGTAGGPHSWNIIKLDGKWYYVDTTFNDGIEGSEYKGYIYLNIPYNLSEHKSTADLTSLYDFATEADPDYCYYDRKNLDFSSTRDAAVFAVKEHGKKVKKVNMRIEGLDVSGKTLNASIKDVLRSYGYTYASWSSSAQYYNGDTYITVIWN